eukprot:TRINITY_DN33589_c0_g1_i1.p1 TRINITY_DN33589_c0_g1~~TRINITY_DN33589_c0_g1_i1.p1  ORF type:complete len:153 (-),score=44.59 TRINITY_DN33589_c0_g1_i1:194-628(-)
MRRTTTMQRKSDDIQQASTIVMQILRPLELFMNNLESSSNGNQIIDLSVDAQTKKEWATRIICEVTPGYYNEAKNLLDSIQSTKDSLSKLGAKRNRGTGGADSLSKVKDQLRLDVQEYGRMVVAFQVDVDQVDGYQDLCELVKE